MIETERLILRELIESDVDGMFELDSSPKVQQFLGKKIISSLAESSANIKFIQDQYVVNGIGRWAVIEKETNCFVGWSGLKLIKETVNNHINYYDLGYRFIPSFWGKGYATESAGVAIKYGFDNLGVKEIIGIADVHNHASIHVLQKLGLKKINIFNYQGNPHHWMKIESNFINS